ncbi:hypothetical protein CXF74_10090 [Psychromonas sp. Urea-02u-13]|uniref:hypothetical protein n=1 Tax=Psychromonas sp. Urea-02u-13 TaxID=2058326 RepID=UPI000C338146|nr:hypothetical protein CXF74_10090 [Psychromonas sp. Urea-02u-13]
MKVFTISFLFSVTTLFLLVILDSGLSNLYCVWPLHLIEATGVLGNNAGGFYNNWYELSMAFSLLVQSTVIYALTSRLNTYKGVI